MISFAASAPNSQQPSYDDLRSPSGNCFTSAKRRQLHSFVTTLNKHVPAKRCSCLVCVRPRLNLISNHRRRSGPTGSVAQREFLSCLIQCCSAATSTLKGVGAHWQSDENATMDPSMSHQDAIDVALIDALHAISNETSKAGTHPSQSTDEACEGSFTRNSGRPLNSAQARESLTVLLLLAFFFFALCLPLYFQNPPFAPPLCLLHILPFLSLQSPVSILYISAYYHALVSMWLLTRVAS